MSRAIQSMTGASMKTRREGVLSYKVKRRLVPLFYVAPAATLFSLLMLFPMIMVLRYSLLDSAIMKKDAAFVGLQNYVTIFEDPVFWQSVAQTLYFTVMSVIFHLLIGLAFALLLNTRRINPVIRSILRVLYILPWLFTAVIIAIIWRLLLDPNGVVNSILMALHIVNFKVEWFSSTRTALHALTFANIWAGYPLYMVSLLAGLQGIPKDLYEAAVIDGANEFQKFRYITIPQLMPIIISIALLDFIWTMQVFPLVWMTTGGGPIYATEVLSTYTYKLAFSSYQFSLASASAMFILILSMSMTYFYIKHQKAR
jgi:multiple sugar transport system permease protein